MIDDKKIEEAAMAHCVFNQANHSEQFFEGFNAGAHWAIQEFLKDLWHNAKEEPRNDYSDILVIREVPKRPATISPQLMLEDIDDDETSYKDEWNRVCKELQITKYLYIGDLLTKQEGGNE